MEVPTAQPSTGSSPAAYPRWVLLEKYGKMKVKGSPCVMADAQTVAASTTSTGRRIQVSLCLAEPPATSSLCVEFPDGVHGKYAIIVAAHGDSLLIQANLEEGYGYRYNKCCPLDLFVYNAGAAAADPPRPPSLFLLPPPINRYVAPDATGILRRDEHEVIVANLKMVAISEEAREPEAAELFMFRRGEWSVRRPQICNNGGGDLEELPSWWDTDTVVPLSDSTLCFVDLTRGILFCNMMEENPCLQHLALPTTVSCFGRATNRNLHVTAGGVLKFVNIFPRCCCGGAGASKCQHSLNAYTIHTWSLKMDEMEWVMDGMVDATEVWALEAYKGLPRVPLDYPTMSMDEPHVINFMLCEDHHVKRGGDRTLWLLMVDTRTKTIRSVSRYPGERLPARALIPSNVSYYFNSYPTCSSDGTSMDQGKTSRMDIEKHKDDNSMNLMLQSSRKWQPEPVQASEILAALLEIPSYGLCGDEMLKAYSILSRDNGYRFRSLLGLPLNLRKDWLLMEIKVGDA